MAKKGLVTGCAGFIGSHLCDKLLSEGWEVIGIDDLCERARNYLWRSSLCLTQNLLAQNIDRYARILATYGGRIANRGIHMDFKETMPEKQSYFDTTTRRSNLGYRKE